MKKFALALLALILCAGQLFANADTSADSRDDEVIGVWLSENGNEKVEIYEENGLYHGKLVWMNNPNDESGKPLLDVNNPEESLRNQTLLGLKILIGFHKKGSGVFKDGKVYDASSGKIYDAVIKVKDGIAKIRAYIGIPLIGKTEICTKVEG